MNINFFKNKLPKIGDYVDVVLTDTSNAKVNGVHCVLPFYNNIGGLIMPTELLKNRREKLTKVYTKGQHMVCTVMMVDETRSYIDLSRRRVDIDDNKNYKILFDKMNRIINFMGIIINFYCEFYNVPHNEITHEIKLNIYDATLWTLSDDILDEPKEHYDLYEKILCEPNILFQNTSKFLSLEFIEHVVTEITKRTIIEPYTLEYCFDIMVTRHDGVIVLNEIMREVFGNYDTNEKYTIELFSLPTYKITFKCSSQIEIDETIGYIENKLTLECNKYDKNVILRFNTNDKFKNKYNILKQKSITYSNGNKNN
jgi:translation initiation factor 2 alpha subunit (eIF-2alpha)